jgi:hypothetical protein
MKPSVGIFLSLAVFFSAYGRNDESDPMPARPGQPRSPGVHVEIHERPSNRIRAIKDSLIRIDIQLGALDSLLKNIPIPEQIEIDDRVLRIRNDSLYRHWKKPPMPETEREDIVKFGEDVIVGRNEVVKGDVVVLDGNATIYGSVEGGVVVVKGDIRLASTARVENDIICIWGNTEVDPGARAGSTKVFNFGKIFGGKSGPHANRFPSFVLAVPVVRMILLLSAVALIAAAFSEQTRRVRRTIEKNYAKCLAAGLITLLLLPFVFLLLMITILGIPIALLLPLAVLGAYLLGMAAFGFMAGEWLLERLRANRPTIVLCSVVGILLFELPSLLIKPLSLFDTPLSFLFIIWGSAVFLLVWMPAFGAAVLSRFGRAPKTSAK